MGCWRGHRRRPLPPPPHAHPRGRVPGRTARCRLSANLHGTELLMLEEIAAGPPGGWAHAQAWVDRLRGWARGCQQLFLASPAQFPRAARLLGISVNRLVAVPPARLRHVRSKFEMWDASQPPRIRRQHAGLSQAGAHACTAAQAGPLSPSTRSGRSAADAAQAQMNASTSPYQAVTSRAASRSGTHAGYSGVA